MVRENLFKVLRSATIVGAAVLSVSSAYAYQGSGGNTTTGCDTDNNIYSWQSGYGACEYSGIGWIYYEYADGFDGTINFGPTSNNAGGALSINSSCTQYGGFWHYGYFQYKEYSGSSGNTTWDYYGFGHAGNPAYNEAGSSVNRDKNIDLVNTNPGHTFYVDGELAAWAVRAAPDDEVEGYYNEYISASGDSDIWGGSLNYFCWGEEMQVTTFEGRISGVQLKDEDTDWTNITNNSSHRIKGNSAQLYFTHQMRRMNDGLASSTYGYWDTDASISSYNDSGSAYLAKNSGWTNVKNSNMSVSVPAGGGKYAYQDLDYSDTVDGAGNVVSWSDAPEYCSMTGYVGNGRWCVYLYRNAGTFTGYVDAQVITDGSTYSNPSTVVMSSDGNYTIKFQHSVVRGSDGAGGTVSTPYSTNVSGSSDRYANMTSGIGQSRSGDSGGITEGATKVVVAYDTETFTGTLYPEETRTFCQSLTYGSIIDADGNTNATTGQRCVTVKREKAICSIDSSSYGVASGENIAKLTVKNNTNGLSASVQGGRTDTTSIWAKPGDMIRYSYETCASGQLSEDYYWGSSASASNFTFTGSNTTASNANKHKYLFGNSLGDGDDASFLKQFGQNATYGADQYEETFVSPSTTDSTYACASSTTNKYYQIPGTSSYNCKSALMVGRNSDAGSVISQTLSFDHKVVVSRMNISNNNVKLTGEVKVPYNYDLATSALATNPGSVPVSAGTTLSLGFKVDVKSRCNSQVQNTTCDETTTGYRTAPKKTKYRVISWTVGKDVSAENVHSNHLGAAIKNDDDVTVGYYHYGTPSTSKFNILASGDDLFNGNFTAASVSIDNLYINHNTTIGTKVCAAVAVWPMDSHDLPGEGIINDSSQSVALDVDTDNQFWRVSNPSCYTVGKKPSFAVKNSSLYAYNGVEASTFTRKVGNSTEMLFGSWAEYGIISSTGEILGMSSGAGFWGGSSIVSSAGRACRFSAMTLANEQCDSSGALGKISLNSSTSSSPQNMVEQIKTRYTAALSSDGTAIPDLGNAEVNLQGVCRYDSAAGTYIKDSSDSDSNYTCLKNGAAYVYSTGTLTISNTSGNQLNYGNWLIPFTIDNYSSRTYVIHAKKIVINKSISYGSAAYEDHTSGHRSTVFLNTGNIPQVIFIADEIIVGESARSIDAWMIADKVDTCGYDYLNNPIDNSATGANRNNVTRCNKQLQINGPVFTKNLLLNRTHGGGGNSLMITDGFYNRFTSSTSSNGTNSVSTDKKAFSSPAEIFTISPEVYIWAYSEGTRFSQATTTYQRELPARY